MEACVADHDAVAASDERSHEPSATPAPPASARSAGAGTARRPRPASRREGTPTARPRSRPAARPATRREPRQRNEIEPRRSDGRDVHAAKLDRTVGILACRERNRRLRPAKSYGQREVLHGLSFAVETGEVFALLGPNGAGKTTTVEILEGYRRQDGGDVRVLGEDPERGGRSFKARIGIVQSSAVYHLLSVREIVELFAGYYPGPAPPAR